MAAKLALIDADLLLKLLDKRTDRPSPPTDPLLREMNTLDRTMEGTLANPALSDLSKSQKMNSLLSRHDNVTRQFQNRPPPVVTVQEPGEPEEPEEDLGQDQWYTKIVDSVPPTLKQKAKNLLDHMKGSEHVRWDADGRVVVDDAPLLNTNVLDLVHSVTRKRSAASVPRGVENFLEALERINTPTELLPNANAIREELLKKRAQEVRRKEAKASFEVTPSRPQKRRKKSGRSPGLDLSRWESSFGRRK